MEKKIYSGSIMYYIISVFFVVGVILRYVVVAIDKGEFRFITNTGQIAINILSIYLIFRFISIARESIIVSNEFIEIKGVFFNKEIKIKDIEEIKEDCNTYLYMMIKNRKKPIVVNLLDIRKKQRVELRNYLKGMKVPIREN